MELEWQDDLTSGPRITTGGKKRNKGAEGSIVGALRLDSSTQLP